jgi:aminomethyltransferase
VVKLDKPGDFVGRAALAAAAQAPRRRVLVGLRGGTRRVPRHGYLVLWDGQPAGTVTSGAPSPTLGVPIAMAYVEPGVADAGTAAGTGAGPGGAVPDETVPDETSPAGTAGGRLAVDIRGRAEPAVITPLPFYHRTQDRPR